MQIKYIKNNKGFTLIELLVVISIIALLSSVVLSSLGAARSKAADNAVKAAMKQLATQASEYRVDNGGFGSGSSGSTDISVCTSGVFNDPRFALIRTNILSNAASGATLSCTTGVNGTKWSVRVTSLRGGGQWCIDNTSDFNASTANTAGECSL